MYEFAVADFYADGGYFVFEVGGYADDSSVGSSVGVLEGSSEESSDFFECYDHFDFTKKWLSELPRYCQFCGGCWASCW